MPDTEMFKLIVQSGSFGLIVLLICWVLFRLEPRIREMIEKKDQLNAETIKSVAANASETIQKTISENRQLVETLLTRFTEATDKAASECRDERKEWMEVVQRESELNRKARHDLANQIQALIAEAYSRNRNKGGNGEDE